MSNKFTMVRCIARNPYAEGEVNLQLWVNPSLVMVVRPATGKFAVRTFLDMFDGSVLLVDGEPGMITSMLRDAT